MQEICHEEIVIVGAGIAGLATALGLHRLGIRSVILESLDGLKFTGFAHTTWTNAWRALDALGVAHSLREKTFLTQGFDIDSKSSKQSSSEKGGKGDIKFGKCESRCVKRRDLLETLSEDLPRGTIRYSSKIVSIEESGNLKYVHLADGSVITTKVLIGCDGVESLVAKWLGLQRPVSTGHAAIRGLAHYPDGHGLVPQFHTFFEGGVRFGFIPCNEQSVYWFCSFAMSLFQYDENEFDPLKLKQFVANNIRNVPRFASDIVDKTELDSICCTALKIRYPWNLVVGNIVKNNVCVAGDALHPMTPDIGQGGCSSLEDGVTLARCLGEALLSEGTTGSENGQRYEKMKRGLEKYAKERRWRSFSLVTVSYIIGMTRHSENWVVAWLRKTLLSKYFLAATVWMSDFDCGKLCAT